MRDQLLGLPDSYEELEAAFEERVECTLQHYGIDYAGLRYSSPGLASIRRLQLKPTVKVAVDRNDLGSVVVICPFTGERIRAACTSRFDVEGVARNAWRRVGKYSKERRISKSRAMNELRKMEEKEVKKGKTRKQRKKNFGKREVLPTTHDKKSITEPTVYQEIPLTKQKNKRTNILDKITKES